MSWSSTPSRKKRAWRLIRAPESCNASPTKIRMKITQNITFTPPLKFGVGELYQNRFKKGVFACIISIMTWVKSSMTALMPSWFSCRVFINFSKEINVEINAGIKITQPKILFKTAMRPACWYVMSSPWLRRVVSLSLPVDICFRPFFKGDMIGA